MDKAHKTLYKVHQSGPGKLCKAGYPYPKSAIIQDHINSKSPVIFHKAGKSRKAGWNYTNTLRPYKVHRSGEVTQAR